MNNCLRRFSAGSETLISGLFIFGVVARMLFADML
jgi:hypothetical protein